MYKVKNNVIYNRYDVIYGYNGMAIMVTMVTTVTMATAVTMVTRPPFFVTPQSNASLERKKSQAFFIYMLKNSYENVKSTFLYRVEQL